ncbi:MAG TPA: hypothetical protein VFC35_09785, partial [Gemmatimonadaceae bacterium]|nr:hypothetical protein [Gemmatimonadaceae bacterium]
SELKHGRTEKTEDVVSKGDRVKVKLLERDERGRLRLSMKALVAKPESEGGSAAESGESHSGAGSRESSEGVEVGVDGGSSSEDRPRRPRSRPPRSGGGRSRE